MFTPQDADQFLHIAKVDDGFVLIQKDLELETNQNNFFIVKSDFEFSRTYTKLKTAKELCELMLGLLGIATFGEGLSLAIEVIKEPKTKQKRSDLV